MGFFDIFHIPRMGNQLFQLSNLLVKLVGQNQKNTIYIIQLQKENDYFRKKMHWETRASWFAKETDKALKDEQEAVARESAKLIAQAKLNQKPENQNMGDKK